MAPEMRLRASSASARRGPAWALVFACCAAGCFAATTATPVPPAPGAVSGKLSASGSGAAPKVVYLEALQAPPAGAAPGGALAPLSIAALLRTRLAVIPAGTSMQLRNDTPVMHDFFSRSEGNAFERRSVAVGALLALEALLAGEVRLYCALHPGEDASLVVTPSAWAATLDAAGEFRIEGVPAGRYRVVAPGEAGALPVAVLQVHPGGVSRVDVTLRAPTGSRER
jgi:hypothetical protein